MIKTFTDRLTQELYTTGKTSRFPTDVAKRARRKQEYVDLATGLEDDRKGQYSISINDQWRICFRFVDGDTYDVEVCDYH